MDIFAADLNQDNSLKSGDLLLSEPLMADDNFVRSVILICDHNEENGSFGLILNEPSDMSVSEATQSLFEDDALYIGGPVEQNTLHFIHTFGTIKGCIHVQNGVYWGGEFDQIKALSVAGKINQKNFRFFRGYSGWEHKQLTQELEHNSWVIAQMNLVDMFQTQTEDLWKNIMESKGARFKMLANYPTDPNLN